MSKNILYECMKCSAEKIYINGRDGVLCGYCNGQLLIIGETNRHSKALLAKKVERWETPCMHKPMYCEEIETGEIYLVPSLHFPLGKDSGKHLTIKSVDGD